MESSDSWSLATAEDDGRPLIFRIREKPPSFAEKEAFPKLLVVAWKYESASDQGMPAPDIVERMTLLEDLLVQAFEEAEQAFLFVIATGNRVREWQWYTRDPEETMSLVNETLGKYEMFPVQFSFHDDPDWGAYARFLGTSG
ncbi:MAG TPA: DUF695 domain-containing protein [Gemmataceae bacterium]|nr:DUF695 domain-containing protein [Gemmataceae bacterium]